MERLSFLKKINLKIVLLTAFLAGILVTILIVFFLPSSQNPNLNNPKEISLTPTPVPQTLQEEVQIPTPIIQAGAGVSINRLGKVTFSNFNNSFPSEVLLFTSAPIKIDPVIAEGIATNLAFENLPQTIDSTHGQLITFKNGSANLTFYITSGNIQYLNSESSVANSISSIQGAEIKASDFLKNFLPYSNNLTPAQDSISYYKNTEDLAPAQNFADADLVEIPFDQKIGGLPVFVQFGSPAGAKVMVSKSGHVVKVNLISPSALSAERRQKIISIEAAKQKILNGEGIIVSYGEPGGSQLRPPASTILSTVKLGYLRDNVNNVLYPIYVFKGNAIVNNNQEDIIIYLPASK